MADGEVRKVRLDEFVSKVIRDPRDPVERLLVTGFVGASSEPHHIRIYWDATLTTYIDVEEVDIVHSEPLSQQQSPLGGSYIWLKQDARVYFGAITPQSKARFLRGPLMTAYGAHIGPMAGQATAADFRGDPGSYYCSFAPGCYFSWNACPSVWCPIGGGGGHVSRPCPQIQAPMAGQAAVADFRGDPGSYYCSFAPGCYFSWNACPSVWCPIGGGGGYVSRPCPQIQAPMAGQAVAADFRGDPGSYYCSFAPGCYFSWNACPSDYCPPVGGGTSRIRCPQT
jgi:hypothetical protein